MGVDVKFNEEAINAHNALRSLHGCAPLAYDAELAQQAQRYAETLAQKNMMVHSQLPGVGENLASRSSTGAADLSATDASLMWYKEILDYQFTGKDQIACGHFSQVVWKDTKLAGFGVAKTADGHSVFVVGQYNPPGNFMGQWGSQVPVPLNGLIVVPTADELMRKTSGGTQIPVQKPFLLPAKPKVPVPAPICRPAQPAVPVVIPVPRSAQPKVPVVRPIRHSVKPVIPLVKSHPQPAPPLTTTEKNDYHVDHSPSMEPDLRNAIVTAHNELRSKCGLQPLLVNSELQSLAQKWAESLKSSHNYRKCDWKFRGQPVGQNIFASRVHEKDAGSIVGRWVDEARYYEGASNTASHPKAANFTQLMWASTSEIGVGVVLDHRPRRSVVVCFYSPAGNTADGYQFNVDNYLH